MKALSTAALALCLLAQAQADDRALVRKAVDNYMSSIEDFRQFEVVRQTERKEFDSDGGLRSREHWVSRFDFIEGVRVGRTIERDGKALDVSARARVEESVREAVAEWKSKPAPERQKQLKKEAEEREFLLEMPDALDYTPLPDEMIGNRAARVWSFKPRPGYRAKSMKARLYEGTVGKVWLDKEELHLVRVQAEVIKTVTVGGFLARIEKGTKFELSQERVEPNRWLPKRQLVKMDVRIMLVKTINRQIESNYREWRRHNGTIWSGN